MKLKSMSLAFGLALTGANGAAYGDSHLQALNCSRYLDYSTASHSTDTHSKNWYSVNDNVMGGRSKGALSYSESSLNFSGSINTNGGGFASIRHELTSKLLSGSDRLRLSVQTDGRAYSVNLRDQASAAARLAHRAPLLTRASNDFQTVDVLFSDLVPTFRGRVMAADSFVPDEALSLSLMLSDGIDGAFALKIQWIDVCRPIQ